MLRSVSVIVSVLTSVSHIVWSSATKLFTEFEKHDTVTGKRCALLHCVGLPSLCARRSRF